MPTRPTIDDCKDLAERYGGIGVMVLLTDGKTFSCTSYGSTTQHCKTMAAVVNEIVGQVADGRLRLPRAETPRRQESLPDFACGPGGCKTKAELSQAAGGATARAGDSKVRLDAKLADRIDNEIATAIKTCEQILVDIDLLPERAEDFGLSVAETVKGIRDTIQAQRRVTGEQWRALENMQHGVGRWLERD